MGTAVGVAVFVGNGVAVFVCVGGGVAVGGAVAVADGVQVGEGEGNGVALGRSVGSGSVLAAGFSSVATAAKAIPSSTESKFVLFTCWQPLPNKISQTLMNTYPMNKRFIMLQSIYLGRNCR